MTKKELLELLERLGKHNYYSNNSNFKLISKLLKDYEENSKELESITVNIANQVIDLLLDCYTTNDLVDWLEVNDWNVFNNIHYSDIREYEEFEEDELQEILNNGDYLFNDEDEKVLVISW